MSFDWTGLWAVRAREPDGGGYEGEIAIAPFGEGRRLRWAIDGGVGTYFGVGLAREEGLYVSCGPTLDGLALLLVSASEARLLAADGERPAAKRFRHAGSHAGVWRFQDGPVAQATLRCNGESHLATLRMAEGGTVEGLAWPGENVVAFAFGAPLERLVILFYPTPADPSGPVSARWALGTRPRLGDELLGRIR